TSGSAARAGWRRGRSDAASTETRPAPAATAPSTTLKNDGPASNTAATTRTGTRRLGEGVVAPVARRLWHWPQRSWSRRPRQGPPVTSLVRSKGPSKDYSRVTEFGPILPRARVCVDWSRGPEEDEESALSDDATAADSQMGKPNAMRRSCSVIGRCRVTRFPKH
ncbi:hypothetical protein THAOC_29874, partial [Thalassiosira oceanica]